MLDGFARRSLRPLNKHNADLIARHLVAAGLALDEDPELAHQHALAAQRRAGRIDVVREAVATTAYLTGRYTEALREARTVRRLTGEDTLRVIEADSERGLGRPDRALVVISEVNMARQPAAIRAELAMVASGARADLGEFEAGLLVIEDALAIIQDPGLRARLLSVRADRLDDLGRPEEAEKARQQAEDLAPEDEDPLLYIEDGLDPEAETEADSDAEPDPDPDSEPGAEAGSTEDVPEADEPDSDEPDSDETEHEPAQEDE